MCGVNTVYTLRNKESVSQDKVFLEYYENKVITSPLFQPIIE